MKSAVFSWLLPGVLLLSLLAGGCRQEEVIKAPLTPVSGRMRDRGAEWSRALAKAPLRGMILSAADLDFYSGRAPALMERLKLLGVNRLYLTVEAEERLRDEAGEALRELLRAAGNEGIAGELLLPQRDYIKRRMRRLIPRKFGTDTPLRDIIVAVREFQETLPESSRLAGVTLAAEIHTFTREQPALPANALYVWSEKAYGAGRDNDILMRQLLADLGMCREELAGAMPFSVLIPDFYHDRAAAGDLGCGAIGDFLAVADRVIVSGGGSRPSGFAESVRPEFAAAAAMPGRVLLGVNLAFHPSETRSGLRRRDWPDLVRIMTYLMEQDGRYPAFGGVVVGPWNSIELLWEK